MGSYTELFCPVSLLPWLKMPLGAGTSPLSHQFLLLLQFLGILLRVTRARADLGFILIQGLTSLADCSDLTSVCYVAFGQCSLVAPGV